MQDTEATEQLPDIDAQVKMHDGELDIDATLVKRLLMAQFPALADQPLAIVRSTGTVNAVYRLGHDRCVRLSRMPAWAEGLKAEWQWLPVLAPQLSLAIPKPLALGAPTAWYPHPWAIYTWIEGLPYRDDLIRDEREAALDLVKFIGELRQINAAGAPRGGRRPLHELDALTRTTIASLRDEIDGAAVSTVWENALAAPPWDGQPVWIHGDLLRSNLLVQHGHLCAVIDFGSVGVGDPAMDVVPAWSVFHRAGRATFRAALQVDDGTWRRARGYALHQALLIMPYYPQTNPDFVTMAKRTIREILTEV